MRSLALDFERRAPVWIPSPEPREPGPGEVLLRTLEAGVCGTDRELARFSYGQPPPGEQYLILGHEALAEVVSAGAGARFNPGDLVIPTVRRACRPACRCCAKGRRDLCLTGAYTERGITGAHGFFAGRLVEAAGDVVPLPAGLADVAVLAEPLSVVEKAIEAALRAHPDEPATALVLGAGPIGLLAAFALQVRGLKVAVASLEESGHPRAGLLRRAGIPYHPPGGDPRRSDIVLEAAGSARAAARGIELLAPLGVLVVMGSPEVPALPAHRLIMDNLTVLGVVNAAPEHYRAAIEDLARIERGQLSALIERRRWDRALDSIRETSAAPKLVHPLAE